MSNPLSEDSKLKIDRYVAYRVEEDNIPIDPMHIGQWMRDHIHELNDPILIDDYLAAKDA